MSVKEYTGECQVCGSKTFERIGGGDTSWNAICCPNCGFSKSGLKDKVKNGLDSLEELCSSIENILPLKSIFSLKEALREEKLGDSFPQNITKKEYFENTLKYVYEKVKLYGKITFFTNGKVSDISFKIKFMEDVIYYKNKNVYLNGFKLDIPHIWSIDDFNNFHQFDDTRLNLIYHLVISNIIKTKKNEILDFIEENDYFDLSPPREIIYSLEENKIVKIRKI